MYSEVVIFSEPKVVQQLIHEGTTIIQTQRIKFIKLNFQELNKKFSSTQIGAIKKKFEKVRKAEKQDKNGKEEESTSKNSNIQSKSNQVEYEIPNNQINNNDNNNHHITSNNDNTNNYPIENNSTEQSTCKFHQNIVFKFLFLTLMNRYIIK